MIDVMILGRVPSGVDPQMLEQSAREAFRRGKRRDRGSVSIRFVSNAVMQSLNRTYRKKNRPTDVLSFSVSEANIPGPTTEQVWGDIVIAPQVARAEAKRRGIGVDEEISRLVVHGVLHLCGYDHATEPDELRMFRLQEHIVEDVCH